MNQHQYLQCLPKINLAQSLEQLQYVNLLQKLKQIKQVIIKSPYQRQTQIKSKYWIELKIYKYYTIAVLKIDRYEGMVKFKNQKSKQQHISNQEKDMFQKTIDNIVKKYQILSNKSMSIWYINGLEEIFQKEIRYQSDIKQYMNIQKSAENPNNFIFTLLIIHQIVNYAKNNSQFQKNLKGYLKIYYSMQKQYLKSSYRILFPNYMENQRRQYYLELQNLFKLNVIFLYSKAKEAINKILNQNEYKTELLININPIKSSDTNGIQMRENGIYYYNIVLDQTLFIQRIKCHFMKFIKDAEIKESISIISQIKQNKYKFNQKIINDKYKTLIKLNSNNKQLTQVIKNTKIADLNQNNITQLVEKIQVVLQSNQETNTWENLLHMWDDQLLDKKQKKQKIERDYQKIKLSLKKQIYQKKLQEIQKQIKNYVHPLFIKKYIPQWQKLKKIKLNKFKLNDKKINVRIPDVSKDIVFKIIEHEYNCRIINSDQKQINLNYVNLNDDQIKLSLQFKQNKQFNKSVIVNKSKYKLEMVNLLVYVYEKQQIQQELSDLEIEDNEQFEKPLNHKTQKLQLWNSINQLILASELKKSQINLLEKQILLNPHQDYKYMARFEETLDDFQHKKKIQPIYKKLKDILLKQINDFRAIRQKLLREARKIHQLFQQEKYKIDKLQKWSNLDENEFCFQIHIELSSNIPPIKIIKYRIKQPILYFIFEWNRQQKQLEYSVWNFNYLIQGNIERIKLIDKEIKIQILRIIRGIYYEYISDDKNMMKFQKHLLYKAEFWRFNIEQYQNILTLQQQEEQQELSSRYAEKLASINNKLRIYSYQQRLYTLLKRLSKDNMLEIDYNNPLMILQYDKSINLLKIKNYKQQIVKLQYCHDFSFLKIKQKIIYMILDEYYKIQKSIQYRQQKNQLIEFNKKRIQRDRLNYLNSPQGRKEQQLRIEKIQAQQLNKKKQQLNKKKIQLQYKRRKEEEQQKRRQQQQKKRQELQKQRKQQEQKRNKKIIKLLSLFSQFRIQVSDNSIKQYLTQFTNNYQYKIIQKSKIKTSIDLLNLLQKYFEQELNSVYQKMKNKELQITVDQNQKLIKIIGEIKKKCNIKLVNRKESLLIVQNNNDMIIICKTDKSKTKITQISMDQDQNILIYNILKYYKKEEQLYEEKLKIKQEQEKYRIRLQNQQKKKQQQLQRLAQEQQKRRKAEENNKIKTKLKNILKIKVKQEDDWKLLQQNIKQISDQYKCQLKSSVPLITVHYKSSQLTIESDYSDKKTYNITITKSDEKFQSMILQEYLIVSNVEQEYMKKLINQIPNQEIKISITSIPSIMYVQQKIKNQLSGQAIKYQLKLKISSDSQMKIQYRQAQKKVLFRCKNNIIYNTYSFEKIEDALLIMKKNFIKNYIKICEFNKNNQKEINTYQDQLREKAYQAQLRKKIEENLEEQKKDNQKKIQNQLQNQKQRLRKKEQEQQRLVKQRIQQTRRIEQNRKKKLQQLKQQQQKKQAQREVRMKEQKIKQQLQQRYLQKQQIQRKKQKLQEDSIIKQNQEKEKQLRIKKLKQQQEQQRMRRKIELQRRRKLQALEKKILQEQKLRKVEEINKIKAKLKNILKIKVKQEDDWKLLQQNIKQISDQYKCQLKSSVPLITVHYKSSQLTIESDYSDKKTYNITITKSDEKFQSMILQEYLIVSNVEQEYMKKLINQIPNQEIKISITSIPSIMYVQQKIKNQLSGQAIKYQLKLKISSDSQMKIQYRQAQKKVLFRCKNNIIYNTYSFEKIEDALLIMKKNFIKNYIKICEFNKNNQKEINTYQDQLREKAYQAQLRKKIEENLEEQKKDNQKKIQNQLQNQKQRLRKKEQEQQRLVKQRIQQTRRIEQNRKKKLQQLKQQQQKKQAQREVRMKEQKIKQQLQQRYLQKQQIQRKKQKLQEDSIIKQNQEKEKQLRIKKLKQQQEQQRMRRKIELQRRRKLQEKKILQEQKLRKVEEINKIKAKLKNILKIKVKQEDDWKLLQQNIKQISDQYKCQLKSSVPLITVHYKSSQLTIESDYSDKKTYNITITKSDEKFQSMILQEYLIVSNVEQEYMKKLINQIPNQEIKISITSIPSIMYVQQKIKNQLSGQAIKYQLKLKISSDSQMKIQYRQAQKKVLFRCKNNIIYNTYSFEKIEDALLIMKKNFIKNYIKICEFNKNNQKEINTYQDQLREKAYQAQLRKKIEENLEEQKKDNQKKIQNQLQNQKQRLRKKEQEQQRLVKQRIQQTRRIEQNRKKKLQQLKQQQQKKQAQREVRMKEQKIKQQLQQRYLQKQQIQRKKQKLQEDSIIKQNQEKEKQLRIKKLKQQQEQQRMRRKIELQRRRKLQEKKILQEQKLRKVEEINKIKAKLKNILKIKVKQEDDWKLLQQNIKQISDQYKCQLKSSVPLITVHYKSSQLTIESDYSDKKTYNITITKSDEKFQSMILQEYLIVSNVEQEYMKKLINQIPNQEIKISITGITYMQQRIKKLVIDLAVEYKLKLNTSSDPQMMIEFNQMQKRINFKTKNNLVYMWYSLDDVQLIVKKYTIPNYILIREYEKKKINIDQCQQIERGYQAQIRKNIEVNFQKEKKLTVMKAQQQFQQQRRRRRQIQEQERSKREQEKRKLQKKLQEDRLARQLQQQKEKQDRQQRRKRLQVMQRKRIEEQRIKQQQQIENKNKHQQKKRKQKQQRQQNILNFRIGYFTESIKESQLILKEIQNLGYEFNKQNQNKILNIIILKNMHDRFGLDLLDSQLNYQFEQLKQILSSQYCLFINLSPKCYLTSKTFKQSFLKRMKLLGHQLNQNNINKYAQFVHLQINILDKKLKYPTNSNRQQFLNILKRFAKASNNQI